MPDNWGFVAAAYGLTAAVLLLYWRRLARKERDIERSTRLNAERTTLERGRQRPNAERSRLNAERSREPSRTGHPRPEPDSRHPLQ